MLVRAKPDTITKPDNVSTPVLSRPDGSTGSNPTRPSLIYVGAATVPATRALPMGAGHADPEIEA